jgi:hypothetical protein
MKTMIFHILRTFRWLIVPILRLLSGLFSLATILILFNPETPIGSIILSFSCAVIIGMLSWYYDSLIKRFSPQNRTNQKWS